VLLSLLYIGFFFQVGAAAPNRAVTELDLRKQELGLLHLSVDRSALRTLLIWDAKSAALRDARPGEVIDDSTPVMLLHLWATWCTPCKEEFPLWRKLGPRIVTQHRGRVRVAHVAIQDDSGDMAGFVLQMRNRLPFPVQHFDREEHLAKQFRPRYPSKQLTLPTTLLLDGDRVVRQAFIGPITERQQELIDSTARLLDLIREQEDAALRPKPPETNDPFSVK
jgi:thiol-disulfide isomerase/thioredoxin